MIEQLFWKLHCPGNICNAPVEFAVDEIGAPAKEQTKRRGYDKVVAQVHPRDFVPMGIVKSEKQHPDHPAMARHAAFPYPQDRQRLAQHFRFVEENVPEAATNDHTEKGAAGDKVTNLLHRQIRITGFCQDAQKNVAANKRQHISQPVPARPDIIVNAKNYGIEIVQIVSEHWCGLSLKSATAAMKTRHSELRRRGGIPQSKWRSSSKLCDDDIVRGPSPRSG